ncbi:SAP domain-containing protein [Streptomyces shenzhenensis]|uniref:SAP domain-containing protein n=1 Tax=Streptomyces shenzhenensis TaxID=943815 RepID=UPI003D8DD56E
MTRVRFQRRMASPTHTARPGDVLDIPAGEAAQRVKAGQCTYVDAPAAPGPAAEDGGQEPKEPMEPGAAGSGLDKLTVDQLKAFAAEQDIDLDGTARKAEILDRIITVLAEREAGDGD